MLAKKYKSEIISIQNPFKGIYTLELKSMNRSFKYKPGQFLHLAIDKDYDGVGQWPESRCFSMQSNPDSDNIKITFAVKGVFTAEMEKELDLHSEVWLKLPYGELFSQFHSKENTVFISGGTGITPFLSLFTHNSFNEYSNPRIYLGFKSSEYNIYVEELQEISNSTSRIEYFYEDDDGIIDIKRIIESNNPQSYYFISGPPPMIQSFTRSLLENGVFPGNILTDDWG